MRSLGSSLFEFLYLLLLRKLRHLLPLQPLLDLLPETLDPSVQQKQVVVAFFYELGGVLNAGFLVEVVDDDDLAFLVLVVVELRDVLVPLDVGAWETQGLLYVILFVFLGFSEVDQQKVSFQADWQLLGFDGDGGEVGSLAACVFFGFVPFVDRLNFLLLVDEFPQGGGFDAPEQFALLFGGFLVAWIERGLLMNSMSLTVVPILPASLDSTWSYLLVFWTLTSRTEGLPGWYPIGRFYI